MVALPSVALADRGQCSLLADDGARDGFEVATMPTHSRWTGIIGVGQVV